MATLMDADAEAVFNQLQVFVQGAAEGGEALRVRRAEVKLADGGGGGVQAGNRSHPHPLIKPERGSQPGMVA